MKRTLGIAILTAAAAAFLWNGHIQASGDTDSAKSATSLTELLGTDLVNARGEPVSTEALTGKKVGLYFSAQWCPPCRAFTPMLVKAHEEWKAQGKAIELVFVSSDRNEEAMYAYMKDYNMDWLAIPYASEQRARLGQHFNVRGIPTLIILDQDGAILSTGARGDVTTHGAAALDRW